jgi:hypothetical protein
MDPASEIMEMGRAGREPGAVDSSGTMPHKATWLSTQLRGRKQFFGVNSPPAYPRIFIEMCSITFSKSRVLGAHIIQSPESSRRLEHPVPRPMLACFHNSLLFLTHT